MNDSVAVAPRSHGGAAGEPLDVEALAAAFRGRTAKIGIIGLGYVGLPLLRAAAERGFSALGFDIDRAKVELLNAGGSYLCHISADSIAALRQCVDFSGCTDLSILAGVDSSMLCVPTSLARQRESVLGLIVSTSEA